MLLSALPSAGETDRESRVFVAQAHSFIQQARLAITLAWVAGYTNIITFLVCGTVTSHVSGTTSNFGRDVVEGLRGTDGSWALAGYALYLLVTFLAGAIISGFTTELGRRRGWDSIYVLPMALQALLLTLFMLTLHVLHITYDGNHPLIWASGIASLAMGLQNATITRISSGVVRTTHVTGVLTDLGLEIVQFGWWLHDRDPKALPPDIRSRVLHASAQPVTRRLALLASILASFSLGAGLGTVAYDYVRPIAMVPPVAFLLFIVVIDCVRPIAEIEPSDLVANGSAHCLPDGIQVFHLRRQRTRRAALLTSHRAVHVTHRLPNLSAWADGLPAGVRVVVLDLSDIVQLDADAAFELRTALARFTESGRSMVLAGVTADQFAELRKAGGMLDQHAVCPDFDLALARALIFLEQQPARTP